MRQVLGRNTNSVVDLWLGCSIGSWLRDWQLTLKASQGVVETNICELGKARIS